MVSKEELKEMVCDTMLQWCFEMTHEDTDVTWVWPCNEAAYLWIKSHVEVSGLQCEEDDAHSRKDACSRRIFCVSSRRPFVSLMRALAVK
mmetsp:Transcript_37329/g.50515  ORF Transcript_37329/g.50515 Transcript_37329/m.50515 type:complete len:90 (-) Transcript_37329:15-284(-)